MEWGEENLLICIGGKEVSSLIRRHLSKDLIWGSEPFRQREFQPGGISAKALR